MVATVQESMGLQLGSGFEPMLTARGRQAVCEEIGLSKRKTTPEVGSA